MNTRQKPISVENGFIVKLFIQESYKRVTNQTSAGRPSAPQDLPISIVFRLSKHSISDGSASQDIL